MRKICDKKCVLSLKRIGIHDVQKENVEFYLNILYIHD